MTTRSLAPGTGGLVVGWIVPSGSGVRGRGFEVRGQGSEVRGKGRRGSGLGVKG